MPLQCHRIYIYRVWPRTHSSLVKMTPRIRTNISLAATEMLLWACMTSYTVDALAARWPSQSFTDSPKLFLSGLSSPAFVRTSRVLWAAISQKFIEPSTPQRRCKFQRERCMLRTSVQCFDSVVFAMLVACLHARPIPTFPVLVIFTASLSPLTPLFRSQDSSQRRLASSPILCVIYHTALQPTCARKAGEQESGSTMLP